MDQQGGLSDADHVGRVLNGLVSPKVQLRLNRTGSGIDKSCQPKYKFPKPVEVMLAGNCVS